MQADIGHVFNGLGTQAHVQKPYQFQFKLLRFRVGSSPYHIGNRGIMQPGRLPYRLLANQLVDLVQDVTFARTVADVKI